MLKYSIKKSNSTKVEEIILEDIYISSDSSYISGTADEYYDLIDEQEILVENTYNNLKQNMILKAEKVLVQGWIEYMKKYPLEKRLKQINYQGDEEEIIFVKYNGQYYSQDFSYDDNGNITLYNTITIPNIGIFNIVDNSDYIRIMTKYYIENGEIDIDGNIYYNQIDFDLLDTTVNLNNGIYCDYLTIDGISNKLYYYSKEDYYYIYKCEINIPEDYGKLNILNSICGEEYRYISYNGNNYIITSGANGSDYVSLNKTKYLYYNGTNESESYPTYNDALAAAKLNGLDSSNVFSINYFDTEESLSGRTYPNYFYNKNICPDLEQRILNNEYEGLDEILINYSISASAYSNKILLTLDGNNYQPNSNDEIQYTTIASDDIILSVYPNIEESSSDNYIMINGKKYIESANSYYSVIISNEEYELSATTDTYNNKKIGYITLDNEKSMVYLNYDNNIITSITKTIIKDNQYSDITYLTSSYGTYNINDKTYVALWNYKPYLSVLEKYRGIIYNEKINGKLLIDRVIGTNQFLCSPIIDESINSDELLSEQINICSNISANYDKFIYKISDKIFGNISDINKINIIPSDVPDFDSVEENPIHVYRLNNIINIPIVLSNSASVNNIQEWAIDKSFIPNEELNEISPIIDMERDIYYPSIYNGNTNCSIPQNMEIPKSIEFNFHFRTRDMSGWTVNFDSSTSNSLTNLCSSYFIFDYPKYSGISTTYSNICDKSDLLSLLKFTDNDVFFQKDKISKSFIRLEFYDSPDSKTQSLLFYSTVFMDSNDLYHKYIKGTDNGEYNFLTTTNVLISAGTYVSSECNGEIKSDISTNTEPVDKDTYLVTDNAGNIVVKQFYDDLRISAKIIVKDRYKTGTSSDGFYIYMFKNYSTNLYERSIYLKVSFNHAGLGKSVQFYYPRTFKANSLDITHLTINSAEINGKEYELYNPYTVKMYDSNNKPVYYRIESALEKNIDKIKKGYSLKDIYYQQYIELRVIYDAINKRYCYYFPFNDNTCYKDNKMIFNLFEIKINDND